MKNKKDNKNLPALKEVVNFIVSEYKPERIILFGSYVTQTEEEPLDIDLLIIKKTNKCFVDRVIDVIQLIRNRFGFKYPIEPLVYTPDEWKDAMQINSIFIRTVLSKGIVLYGKE